MAFGTGTSWGIGTAGRSGRLTVGNGGFGGGSTTSMQDSGGGGNNSYSAPPPQQQVSPFDQYVATNPQFLQYGNQMDRIAAQIPFQSGYYDWQAGNQNTNYQNALASLGLQGQGNNIDRGAVARDLAYYDAMKAQAGAERKNQGDQNNNSLATTGRDINSASAAAGNWFAPGRNDQISDAYKNWGTTNTGLDISYQRDILGLDKAKGEAQDRNAKLDLAASQLGLDKDKLKSNLEQGLGQLGYDKFTNVNSLLDALDSSDANRRQLAQQIIQDAVSAGVDFGSGQIGDQYSQYNPYYQQSGPNPNRHVNESRR